MRDVILDGPKFNVIVFMLTPVFFGSANIIPISILIAFASVWQYLYLSASQCQVDTDPPWRRSSPRSQLMVGHSSMRTPRVMIVVTSGLDQKIDMLPCEASMA